MTEVGVLTCSHSHSSWSAVGEGRHSSAVADHPRISRQRVTL